jgi:hypothetical protein
MANKTKKQQQEEEEGKETANAAAKALRCLLEEDPLLKELQLTQLPLNSQDPIVVATKNDKKGETVHDDNDDDDDEQQEDLDPALAYAAALIYPDYFSQQRQKDIRKNDYPSDSNSLAMSASVQQKAKDALVEVERKLALVTSLCERISREKPEHVAGPFLQLHGFSPYSLEDDKGSMSMSLKPMPQEYVEGSLSGINFTLDKCDRLTRQSQLLDTVANRVESALERGLDRMSNATMKLERVLKISEVLKMIMKLKFEAKKVMGSGGLDLEALERSIRDWNGSTGIIGSTDGLGEGENGNDHDDDDDDHYYKEECSASQYIDLRDLTRAAASVAIMEELMNHEDLKGQGIDIVEEMRPDVERISRAVRKAAAGLLEEQQQQHQQHQHQHHRGSIVGNGVGTFRLPSATRLGATLQVYYHLGELPSATWNAVCLGLDRAEKASGMFLNPSALKRIMESAKAEAKEAAERDVAAAVATLGSGDKKQKEIFYDRAFKVKMREKKAEAASKWATSIAEAALHVFNLHRVLLRKTDPVTRKNFMDIVHAAPIPEQFQDAQELFATSWRLGTETRNKISIFTLFWNQMCINLGTRLQRLLKYENGSMASDVATFYPAIRAAALDMLTSIQETMQAGALSTSSTFMDEVSGSGSGMSGRSIMGGTAALDDALLLGTETRLDREREITSDPMDVGLGITGADQWTRKEMSMGKVSEQMGLAGRLSTSSHIASALSSILTSPEWQALQGTGEVGLYPLQRVFIANLCERLKAPLKRLFLENRVVDENGIDMRMLPSLPSEKDLDNLEKIFRNELSIADPREGGGDFSMTTMVSESIVDTIEIFCSMAKGATSGVSEDQLLHSRKCIPTEELLHDMKVADILASLTDHLRNLPQNTFIVPYRPAYSRPHEEAANMCQIALLPAIHEIESVVKHQLLTPLCNVLNRDIRSEIASMHRGAYIESDNKSQDSFVQDHLAPKYENILTNILSRLPDVYCGIIVGTICKYSIYYFLSNASLIRPLGETGRLRLIQDLTDFELMLEHFSAKGGGSTALNQIDGGKPYAELRAVRQMLFWNGLEDKSLSSEQVSKSLFAEVWIKEVRPSTVLHFLLSFAPPLLSSPHHASRTNADEYADRLVHLDGSTDDGEGKGWVTMTGCCEAYFQRETVDSRGLNGDKRVPAILMIIGPELLRRRRS